jgi:hypothetical protein
LTKRRRKKQSRPGEAATLGRVASRTPRSLPATGPVEPTVRQPAALVADLAVVSDVEHDRDGTVVPEFHRHPRAEDAGLDRNACLAERLAEAVVERLGDLRPRRLGEVESSSSQALRAPIPRYGPGYGGPCISCPSRRPCTA